MIKKTLLLICLLFSTHTVLSENRFYNFVIHATHGTEYDTQAWEKSVQLMDALDKYCNDTDYDASFAVFLTSIDETIKTIKKIMALYKNKPNLNVSIRILRKPCEIPQDGLFFSVSSAMESTPDEDYILIDGALEDAASKNELAILDVLRSVVILTSGEIVLDLSTGE